MLGITRYKLYCGSLVPSDDGDWVSEEDVFDALCELEDLREKNDELRRNLDAIKRWLRAVLEDDKEFTTLIKSGR